MFKRTKLLGFLLLMHAGSLLGQSSPYGTGSIFNQVLGNLQDNSVIFESNTGLGNNGFFPDPSAILPNATFDIYVPTTYDGSEPYGLITYISSVNDGGIKPEWIPVLESHKLILVAGDNIGNSQQLDIRMGTAWAAVYRMKELFNIDTSRIYSSGQSGGARMAQTLAYIYPEWISGTVPICGSSYPTEVAQDYETQDPDGHYEVIFDFYQSEIDYIKGFGQRFGIMTSFNDYREGDIMNIYYNGFEQNGFAGKFLETAGNHCATTTAHFLDAINFVEHPEIMIQKDHFTSTQPETGPDYFKAGATVSGGVCVLEADPTNGDSSAYLKTTSGFKWNNPYGTILSTNTGWTGPAGNDPIRLGCWEYSSDSAYCINNGFNQTGEGKGLVVSVFRTDSTTHAVIIASKAGITDTLFSGQFSDWDGSTPLRVKWHLWDAEWRVEFGKHFVSSSTMNAQIRLLDDRRAVRIRWSEMNGNTGYWNAADWTNGAYFIASTQKPDSSNADVSLDDLEIRSGNDSVFIDPVADVSIIQDQHSIVATAGFANYQWWLNGQLVAEGPDNILPDVEEGTYTVVAENNWSCSAGSNSISISYAGLKDFQNQIFSTYPNPVSGSLTIKSSDELPHAYRLYSVNGTVLQEGTFETVTVVPVQHLVKGIYLLRIDEGEAELIVKE